MLKELKETMYKHTAAIKKFISNTMEKYMLINLTTYRNRPILQKLPNLNQDDRDL